MEMLHSGKALAAAYGGHGGQTGLPEAKTMK